MPIDDEIRAEHVERAAEVARGHASREALAAFALDVISRQAEGERLFAGKEWVDARAEEHDVTREAAETKLGNLVEVLERGPEHAAERALVGAFALLGLGVRLEKQEGQEGREGDDLGVLTRFVRHADWLEVSSVSWFGDYQARRANVRWKAAGEKGTQVCHTVNGSAMGWPRTVAAVLETHRRPDGSIAIPEVLQARLGGATHIPAP